MLTGVKQKRELSNQASQPAELKVNQYSPHVYQKILNVTKIVCQIYQYFFASY